MIAGRNGRSGYCFPHDVFSWHAGTHTELHVAQSEIRIASLFPIPLPAIEDSTLPERLVHKSVLKSIFHSPSEPDRE